MTKDMYIEHAGFDIIFCIYHSPLRAFDLVKDRDTGNSKGYGFCVYQVFLLSSTARALPFACSYFLLGLLISFACMFCDLNLNTVCYALRVPPRREFHLNLFVVGVTPLHVLESPICCQFC